MKKNRTLVKLMIRFLFIFLLIVYFGIESKNMDVQHDTFLFLTMYLDNTQKYLFTGTLFLCITVPVVHIPFLIPELKARLRNNTFEYVWCKNATFALILSVFILFSFGIVSAFCGYSTLTAVLDISLFFRLFSFILSFLVLYTVVYLRTGKYYLGITLASTANFLFLILLISFNYYIKIYSANDDTLLFVFFLYVWIINLSGIIYLYKHMDRKEYLS